GWWPASKATSLAGNLGVPLFRSLKFLKKELEVAGHFFHHLEGRQGLQETSGRPFADMTAEIRGHTPLPFRCFLGHCFGFHSVGCETPPIPQWFPHCTIVASASVHYGKI